VRPRPGSACSSLVNRGDGAHVGIAGADANRLLERHDEDLAVADLAGAGALAERADGRIDELVGDGDLQRTFSERPICTVVPR